MLGLLKPTMGTIRLMGWDIGRYPQAVKGLVGYSPQHPLTYTSLTVGETMTYVLRMHGWDRKDIKNRVSEALETMGLTAFSTTLGYQLSPGMRKLLLLGMAIFQETPILVLDEPTSMVDALNKARIWKLLSSLENKTIFLSSHDLNEVRELCDRTYLMVNGEIVIEGSPQVVSTSLNLPAEVQFIPEDVDAAEMILTARAGRFHRSGMLFTVEFDRLQECVACLKDLSDSIGLRYVFFEGPSFEKVVIRLMEDRSNG
jgi:ABC-2 type transport system ATP-binding protein